MGAGGAPGSRAGRPSQPAAAAAALRWSCRALLARRVSTEAGSGSGAAPPPHREDVRLAAGPGEVELLAQVVDELVDVHAAVRGGRGGDHGGRGGLLGDGGGLGGGGRLLGGRGRRLLHHRGRHAAGRGLGGGGRLGGHCGHRRAGRHAGRSSRHEPNLGLIRLLLGLGEDVSHSNLEVRSASLRDLQFGARGRRPLATLPAQGRYGGGGDGGSGGGSGTSQAGTYRGDSRHALLGAVGRVSEQAQTRNPHRGELQQGGGGRSEVSALRAASSPPSRCLHQGRFLALNQLQRPDQRLISRLRARMREQPAAGRT